MEGGTFPFSCRHTTKLNEIYVDGFSTYSASLGWGGSPQNLTSTYKFELRHLNKTLYVHFPFHHLKAPEETLNLALHPRLIFDYISYNNPKAIARLFGEQGHLGTAALRCGIVCHVGRWSHGICSTFFFLMVGGWPDRRFNLHLGTLLGLVDNGTSLSAWRRRFQSCMMRRS